MKNKALLYLLFFIYLAFMLRITVFREEFGSNGLFENGNFNFVLFSDLVSIYQNSKSRFYYLFLGNIFTFMPFGFLLLPLLHKRKSDTGKDFFSTILWGGIFSLTIELSQWAFGVGVSELDDLVLNTFGVFLGSLCCLPFLKSLRRIRRKR